MSETFVTNYHNYFKWPYIKAVEPMPCEPPTPSFVKYPPAPPVAPYCHCSPPKYSLQLQNYEQLLKKKEQVCDDYRKTMHQLTNVTNDILDSPCENDNLKMASIYQTDYTRQGMFYVDYPAIKKGLSSTDLDPIFPHKLGRGSCYFDPCKFVSTPVSRPRIDSPREVCFGRTPETVTARFKEGPNRSEYQDTISKMGKATWRSSQRFKEPLPSTRRREDDPHV